MNAIALCKYIIIYSIGIGINMMRTIFDGQDPQPWHDHDDQRRTGIS
jgi:hypothetical protein